MRGLAILLVPFFLAGCALPPALTLASFAADGISYVATGKSTTDHALSTIASEDCVLIRVVKEEPICLPDHKAPVFVVATKPPAMKFSDMGGNKSEYQTSPTSLLAFLQAHKTFSEESDRTNSLLFAKKNLPAIPVEDSPFQLANKDSPAVPVRAGISVDIGRIGLAHCIGGGGMQPAAQCILGADAGR